MTVQADVVVVGAGTAGLQAALQLARVGRSVVVLERRVDGQSGARWCNGVLAWQYERAGLEPPVEPERRAPSGGTSVMVSPTGRHRFRVTDVPVIEADMRELVARLRRDAVAAGVDIRWSVADPLLELDWGRPVAIRATHEDRAIRIEADLFVDAAGRSGVLRSQVPELSARCPPASPADTCSAHQLVLEVTDPDGASAFLTAHDAKPGESVVSVGVAGGYSTINVTVDRSLQEVSILTGSIPSLGHATGLDLVKVVRALHPWIGEARFGGGGFIPLRRTYHRFTGPGIALVGDAAAQVMGGHGSGIGMGLMAGKVLAEAVGATGDPGDPDLLWRYQATFLREFGAVLAGYDAVRRMSVTLGSDGVEALFAAGVFSPTLVRPGLDQRLGALRPGEAAQAAQGLAARPAIARVVVPALAAMTASRAIYAAYPRRRDERAFRAWEASTRILPRQSA